MTKKQFRMLRGLIGLSQAKLAKEMGVTLRTVARWELGEFPIPRVAELALRNLFRESLKETIPWEQIKKDMGISIKAKNTEAGNLIGGRPPTLARKNRGDSD